MKIKCLLGLFVSFALSGCVTYTSEYANDGYYSSPNDSYNDYGDDYYGDPDAGYDDYNYDDGYYGNTGNYGQYSYGSGGFSSISISFNFGPSFSRYGYYPSYYGYSQCSHWSAYCYSGYNPSYGYGYGWGYNPYYSYNPHHPKPHHNPKPKPKPPEHRPDFPRLNAGQPALHPRYPIVDRPDGPRQRPQQYRPVNAAPQQQVQTQPIANGGSPNTPQYPRQQPRPRPVVPPIQNEQPERFVERERNTERERNVERYAERYAERVAMPHQQPNNPQRQTPRARPVQLEEPTNNYVRYQQTPRNTPVQQGQAPRNRPINANQQTHGTIVAQQMPQQQAQPRPQPERRERVESKPREQKAERERDGDEP